MSRLLRYQVAVSLDGFIAGPKGESDWIVMDPAIDFGFSPTLPAAAHKGAGPRPRARFIKSAKALAAKKAKKQTRSAKKAKTSKQRSTPRK